MHVVHTNIHLNKYNFKRNYIYIYMTVFPCKHNCHAWFTSQMLVFCIDWVHRIYFFTTVINVLPLLWNSVPLDICHIHFSHAFKTTLNLKTHLYKQYQCCGGGSSQVLSFSTCLEKKKKLDWKCWFSQSSSAK